MYSLTREDVMQAEAEMKLSESEVLLVEVAAMRAVQPFVDKLTGLAREVAEVKQKLADEDEEKAERKAHREQVKAERRHRTNRALQITLPIASALVIAVGVWVWNQHTVTVELRAAVESNATAIGTLTETVKGVNRRSNSQATGFTTLKLSVDDVLKAHRALMAKSTAVQVEPPSSRVPKRRQRRTRK
jgi:cytoskeletal protein RodZ